MSKRRLSDSSLSDDRPSKRTETAPDDDGPATGSETSLSLVYPSTTTSPVRPVPFQQPTELLTFSYTPQRVLEFNDSALRYYIDPPPGAELRYGYERWIKRPEERGRLDGLLRAVQRVIQKTDASTGPGSGKKWLKDIAVVTWRGIMTKILVAPYEERDKCELNAMYINGTLYLEEHSSDARLAEKENLPARQRQQTYYGYSFESWCTSSRPGIPERLEGHPIGWGGDVDTNVQWCSVIKTKLGDNRLVIGGEVDCVRNAFDGRTDAFVELKTSMSIRGPQDEARFEKKLLKFYMQSFLLGVPEIVVGFRTPAGRLTTLQSFKTIQIPRLVRGKPNAWDPQICLSWAQHFLSSLRTHMTSHASSQSSPSGDGSSPPVWRIVLTPKEDVKISLLDEQGVQEVLGGEDRVGFLPTWYFDQITNKVKPEVPTTDAQPPSEPKPDEQTHHGWNI